MEMAPTKVTKGGEVRIVDSSKFKASENVAMAMVTVPINHTPMQNIAQDRAD